MRNLWLAALFSIACVKPRGPIHYVGDPEAVVAIARTRPAAEGLRARFSIRIRTPEMSGTTPGSFIIRHPDRIRAEIYTPLGTPLLYLVSDGTSLHAWLERQRVFFRGDEAATVLGNLTGGAVGIDDVVALMTARLPMPDSETLHTGRIQFEEGGVVLELEGPGEVTVRAVVDPATGMVLRLRVWQGESASLEVMNGLIMDVRYEGRVRVGKVRLPARVEIHLPAMDWTITLTMKSWAEFQAPPSAFQLRPPVGAQVEDLVEALRDMAEKRAVHP